MYYNYVHTSYVVGRWLYKVVTYFIHVLNDVNE